MANKFVINNGELIIGRVKYHMDLCKDNSKTIGGGFFEIGEEYIELFGTSVDYGSVSIEDIETAKWPIRFEDKKVLFSTDQYRPDEGFSVEPTFVEVQHKYVEPKNTDMFIPKPNNNSGIPIRNTGPKIRRNAQCHCGSGKKLKRCCLDKK